MTKMKNTKKGMAKKALSISLVAAMLATSNVPVWAAFEADDATPIVVEAPVAEAPAAEDVAPVAEDVAPVISDEGIEAFVEGSQYTATVTFDASVKDEMEWNTPIKATVSIKDGDTPVTSGIKYVWKIDGVQANGSGATGSIDANSATTGISYKPVKEDCGGTLTLYLYDSTATTSAGTWSWTSSKAVAINPITINGSLSFSNAKTPYTGKDVTKLPGADDTITVSNTADGTILTSIDNYNWVLSGEKDGKADMTNVGATITATGTLKSNIKGYTGTITGTYEVVAKEALLSGDKRDLKAEYVNTSYEYTGTTIVIPKEDIKVTDITGGNVVVKDAVASDITTNVTNVGNSNTATATLDDSIDGLKNYSFINGKNIAVDSYFSVIPRDLSTVRISISPVSWTGSTISAATVKNNMEIKDSKGNVLDAQALLSGINVEISSDVKDPGTYTATIKAVSGNKNIINSQTVNFSVVAHSIASATVTKEADLKTAMSYTGSQITKGITSQNISEKIGDVTVSGEKLVYGTDYKVEFGENIHHKTGGQIKLVGLGSYAGTEKVFEFAIEQAEITSIKAPEKVVYNESYQKVDEYGIKLEVKAKIGTGSSAKDVVVPESEYKITYSGSNTPNTDIKSTITMINAVDSDFKLSNTLTYDTTTIVNRSLSDAKIELTKDTYTYTGSAIVPEYKVIDNGNVLEKGVDYNETITNGKNVGTATITIKPVDGNTYDEDSTLTATFTIVAANAEDVTLKVTADKTYSGKRQTLTSNEYQVLLGTTNVTSEFKITFPTSSTENVNAGKEAGKATLTPTTTNFTGTKEATFEIKTAQLTGTLKVYDEKGMLVNFNTASFTYDGTAKEFSKVVFTPTGTLANYVTADDYEIQYVDNVSGNSNNKAAILVVAKGNFSSTDNTSPLVKGVYTCEDKTEVKNVAVAQQFTINGAKFDREDISVSNGVYAGGLVVKPVVVITRAGKTLVEGTDYELDFSANALGTDMTNATNGKTLKVTVKAKGGYTFDSALGTAAFTWGIDKFDLEDATVEVKDGTVVSVKNGSLPVPEADYEVKDNDDGTLTISAKANSKNYTGSQTVDKVGDVLTAPAITASVDRNMVDVALTAAIDGATAYDYVLCKSAADLEEEAYFKSKMSVDATSTQFQFVREGQYYIYARAAKRDENGKKVVSDWSVAAIINITCDTPNAPTVTKVTTKGNTVTVTYTTGARTEGVDVMLGGAIRKQLEDDAMRPVNYNSKTGLIKNVPATTKTVTFTNVAKGTYFVGVHPYITSNDGLKYFGRWSKQTGITKVVVG